MRVGVATDLINGTGWFAAPNWIFERQDLLHTDKLVYLYLCRRAGPDGSSWPSIRRIAKDTGLTPNTVRSALQRLEQAGLLMKQPRRSEHGDADTHLYTLNHVVQKETHLVQNSTHVVQQHPGGVVQKETHGGSKGDHEGQTLKDTQVREKDNYVLHPAGGSTSSPYTQEFEEFWDAYPRKREKRRAFKCWQARKREGYRAADMITAARNYARECAEKGTLPHFIKLAATFLGPSKPFEDYIDGVPDEGVGGGFGDAERARIIAELKAQEEAAARGTEGRARSP